MFFGFWANSGFGFCDMILGFRANSGFWSFDTILGFWVQGLLFSILQGSGVQGEGAGCRVQGAGYRG